MNVENSFRLHVPLLTNDFLTNVQNSLYILYVNDRLLSRIINVIRFSINLMRHSFFPNSSNKLHNSRSITNSNVSICVQQILFKIVECIDVSKVIQNNFRIRPKVFSILNCNYLSYNFVLDRRMHLNLKIKVSLFIIQQQKNLSHHHFTIQSKNKLMLKSCSTRMVRHLFCNDKLFKKKTVA